MNLQELIEFAQQMQRLHGDLEVFFKMSSDRFVSIEEFAVYTDPTDNTNIFVLQSDIIERSHLKVIK
jgi:hypothetical protein